MKFSAIVLSALCFLAGVEADIKKQCTIGKSVECWYNGFNSQGKQYRCAVPGQYAVAYAFGLCPDTYGGYKYGHAECILAGEYNGRHKCRDGFHASVVSRDEPEARGIQGAREAYVPDETEELEERYIEGDKSE